MSTIQELSRDLLDTPIEFERSNGIQKMLDANVTFDHLRTMVQKIYDLNGDQLRDTSNANEGTLGKLNSKSSEKRRKLFEKKMKRLKAQEKSYVIYCEGDSWFQFPRFIKDIIDWLNDKRDLLIMSDAYGGDWITNIIYEGEYISSLSIYTPEIFLISGGGNDLVGNHGLAMHIDRNPDYKTHKYSSIDDIQSDILTDSEKSMVLEAGKYFNKEFYALLHVFRLQYALLFKNLYKPDNKHKSIISITQGYDYPIPNAKNKFSFRYPIKPIVNSFLGNGKWLCVPFKIKGIHDQQLQKKIMFAMIYEFNEMMSTFAFQFDNVFHVDSRGFAREKDWYDELHLKSHKYKKVAQAYELVIRNYVDLRNKGRKIIRTAEI